MDLCQVVISFLIAQQLKLWAEVGKSLREGLVFSTLSEIISLRYAQDRRLRTGCSLRERPA